MIVYCVNFLLFNINNKYCTTCSPNNFVGTATAPSAPPVPRLWIDRNGSPLKISAKVAVGVLAIAIISGTSKSTDFKFGWYIYREIMRFMV